MKEHPKIKGVFLFAHKNSRCVPGNELISRGVVQRQGEGGTECGIFVHECREYPSLSKPVNSTDKKYAGYLFMIIGNMRTGEAVTFGEQNERDLIPKWFNEPLLRAMKLAEYLTKEKGTKCRKKT